MFRGTKKTKNLIALLIVGIMLIVTFTPFSQADESIMTKGFDKGVSYTNVIPTKKTTFVNFDDESLTDDYAYLAAVPTAVFNHKGTLYSHPLLYYQDRLKIDDEKEKSLDAYEGIAYLMDDWTEFCGELDQMTLINVDENQVNNWRSVLPDKGLLLPRWFGTWMKARLRIATQPHFEGSSATGFENEDE